MAEEAETSPEVVRSPPAPAKVEDHQANGDPLPPSPRTPNPPTEQPAASIDGGTKDLPPPPPTESQTEPPAPHEIAPPEIVVASDANGESDAPPPPPKTAEKALPQGIPILTRGESSTSMQDVELSRTATPSIRQESEGPRPNSSVTSFHSTISSPPGRPGSARPRPSTHDHSRRSSTATTLSLSSNIAGPQLSSVLITPPLQVLVNSKEAKRSASFSAAAQRALDLCQTEGSAAYLHPREIFEPLRLAISNPQTTSAPILITSLDLLSKLISHSFFHEPHGPPKGYSPLPDLITHTITLSYSEASPPQVALQVVKALMAIVLSTDMLVHQSSLLKAIRTVYNVFLLSQDPANQVVAQGGLTQMVHHVFGRVVRPDPTLAGSGYGRRSTVSENEARRLAEEGATPDNGGISASQTPGPIENDGTMPKMTL